MHPTTPANATTRENEAAVRTIAMAYPGAHEDFPWGHRAIKVNGKMFVIMSADGDGLSLTVKLTRSHDDALELDGTQPTGYGMGKHGWVSAQFGPDADLPLDVIRVWINESFRAVAPKKSVALLDAGTPATAAAPAAAPAANPKAARAAKPTPNAGRAVKPAPAPKRASQPAARRVAKRAPAPKAASKRRPPPKAKARPKPAARAKSTRRTARR